MRQVLSAGKDFAAPAATCDHVRFHYKIKWPENTATLFELPCDIPLTLRDAASVDCPVRNQCCIPPDDLPHVFDRSYRVQKDRSTRTGNFGLGLAIVRSIVELHGGNVELHSTVQTGTRAVLIFVASDLDG